MVMVDCSFCYFSGSSGFDSSATTRRRDAASGQSSPEHVVQIFCPVHDEVCLRGYAIDFGGFCFVAIILLGWIPGSSQNQNNKYYG